MTGKVKVFVSETCPVCRDMRDDLAKLADTGEVEVVSIDSEAGFDQFAEVAMKDQDEAGIPTAYAEGEKCQILRGNGKMALKCGEKLIGAVPDEVES